ncbi:MAG: hypothetical protein KAX65_08325 [Caldilineaceae bacterium]|nr:hypothetical protein [Caldilineaceae bacterium]
MILRSTLDANTILYAVTDNTPAALALTANTFPARASTGDILAKPITDDALAFVAAANDAAMRTELGLGTMATATATDYLLASGATTGATAQRQTFTNGILSGAIQVTGNATPASGVGLELSGHATYSQIRSVNRDTASGMPIYFNWGLLGDMVFSGGGGTGNMQVGGTANRGTTVSTRAVNIFDGTAPAGTLANGITLYSSGGEPYVMGAAGGAAATRNLLGSSAGGADAHLVATDAAGVTALVGLVSGYIAPASDGVGAVQIRKADKTTPIIYVDTTNGRLGINTSEPTGRLMVADTDDKFVASFGSSGMGSTGKWTGINFGYISGSNVYKKCGIVFECTNANYTLGTLHFLNNSASNSANASLADARLSITSNGAVGVNKTSSIGSKFAVVGLVDYANNAAAVTGGLSAGDFYTETGTNPKRVCVVY